MGALNNAARTTAAGLLLATTILGSAVGCTRGTTASSVDNQSTSAQMTTAAPGASAVAPAVDRQLAADLALAREEQRLALELYTAFGEKWDSKVFENIARSEQRHVDRMLALLEPLGLDDPTESSGTGEFSNPDLQHLYDEVMARGSKSLTEALQAAKTVEENNIAHLDEMIARTGDADVLAVYGELRAGSVNHLAAFEQQLETASAKPGSATDNTTQHNTANAAKSGAGTGSGQGLHDGSGAGQGKGQGKRDGTGSGQGAE